MFGFDCGFGHPLGGLGKHPAWIRGDHRVSKITRSLMLHSDIQLKCKVFLKNSALWVTKTLVNFQSNLVI